MKNRHFAHSVLPFLFLSLIILSCGGEKDNNTNNTSDNNKLSGEISLSGSYALYPLVNRWAKEFSKENPAVKVNVRANGSQNGLNQLLAGKITAAMLARPLTEEEKKAGLWDLPVAKDAVLPVISFDNDYIQDLVRFGLTKYQLKDVFSGKIKDWKQLVKNKPPLPIQIFSISDSSGAAVVWRNFLGLKPGELTGKILSSETQLISELSVTPNGIGYASISSIYNVMNGLRQENIYVLPINYNENSVIDDEEQFFDKLDDVKKAILDDKLPSPPVRELYLVFKSKPTDKLVLAFLNWVLTIGQNYADEEGWAYIPKEKAAELIKQLQ